MHQLNGVVFLVLLFIAKYQAQDTTTSVDWYGDPNLCTVNSPTPTTPSSLSPPPMPKFPNRAEFAIEEIDTLRLLNVTVGAEMTLLEYLYDYDANSLITVKNKDGIISAEYYYYNVLNISTYFRRDLCVVSAIPTNDSMKGESAIKINDVWHIRSLNEFLLFSSDDPSRLVKPVYLGIDIVRGISVHKWQSCYVDKPTFTTKRLIWTFAQEQVDMPGKTNSTFPVPIQAIISGSKDLQNGTQLIEIDKIYNVLAYRPGIRETSDALSPPKGVFCENPGQTLVSLKDVSVGWPNHFSVRVETSTSRSSRWERFHLRYDQGRDGNSRRLRYDYMPPGAEDFRSVIHDYTDNVTYTIDLRVGSCTITSGVEIPDVSPIRNPIEFFVKHEAYFILNPPENAWEFNGFRPCRGNDIRCTILTTSIGNFPPIVDVDTGMASGESWTATNVEYGWSMRAPFATVSPDRPDKFNYPVSLYLKMYRYQDPANPSLNSLLTEDIEYEFYEMSYDRDQFDFDTSLCYRALNYEYLHLYFTYNVDRVGAFDNNGLNRRELGRETQKLLASRMQIKSSRITDIEIDHEAAGNRVQVFFTLLGRTPKSGTQSGFDDSEPTAEAASSSLKTAIDGGNFQVSFTLNDSSIVKLTADASSLKSSKQYISSHRVGKIVYTEKNTGGSPATAIIVGLIIGIIAGIIIIAIVRIVRKEPMPALPVSLTNPLSSSKTKTPAAASSTTENT
ncbi:unnamed protein product [Rotaria sp. Silwood2]|nr:unnamed protein product [Rotaria sp. Silwood2]CAF2628894.1 unnamed protein product [Rotaria sp. Silwood2]CAF2879065.1 unnamed protein product [Rotaria sp. Silwood2]CAF3041303.1 unnamed protein product [Rotaria sp. Silwood2]CAF3896811.1 unnamed protein product [Rotaria sp. Silwood2]